LLIQPPFFNGDNMNIVFKHTTDPSNVVNKTFTNEHSETITARRDFNIQTPVIDLLVVSGEDFEGYNYFTISELGRSYFIRERERVNSDIVRVYGETDYLETYRTNILALECEYYREMGLADYGKVNLSTTGEKEISSVVSSFEPELEINNILSVIKQSRYTE